MTVGHPLTEQTQEPRFSGPSDADLETLLLIRHFELTLLDLFARGEVGGTTHTCLGQEIIPVALAPLLDGDHVFSNHRGHGHYLAHCEDPEGLLAEIIGREGAVCAGVGGSQHLHRERYLSTGVQGQTLPIAVGVGLHLVGRGEDRVVVVYVGDGTWGEGAVYEALNMAGLWRVPLLLVVEDNGIAQSTPTRRQMAGTVAERARAFGIPFRSSSTLWVDELRAEIAPVLDRVRRERTPAVFQVETVRLGPHSKGDDQRGAEELERARERDWYVRYERRFGERFTTIDRRQKERVSAIVTDVLARPLSTWEGGR